MYFRAIKQSKRESAANLIGIPRHQIQQHFIRAYVYYMHFSLDYHTVSALLNIQCNLPLDFVQSSNCIIWYT